MTIWQRFRVWRRSRPFWGGLLTLLAGLEIFGSMNLEINGGTIAIGQEGFASYLVVMVLVLCGVLAWFTPQQRHFYGLLAALVAIYSLIGVNLGGFFIGMLLGVAGGGLIFAWNPEGSSEEAEADEVPDEEPDTGELPAVYLRDGVPTPREEQDQDPKASSPRHAAMMIMVVALSVSMLAVMGAQTRAEAADPCGQPGPGPSASPSPSATATGGGSGSGSGGILGGIVDLFGRLLGGGSSQAQPEPSTTPSPTTPPTPSPCPTSPGDPGGPGNPPGNPGGGGTTKPATPKAKVLAAAPDQVPVAKRPSKMTGSRVQMNNLVFDGIVNMPTVDGTLRVLKFTMTSSDTNDFLLHVYNTSGGTFDTDLRSSKLTVRGGGVQFFTTRFRGNLFGLIPVDYTPDTPPPPIPLPFVFFTDPDIQLVWVDSPALDAPNLRITLAKP
ncbi:MAG TPA: DUF6114 domain-containing protein [Candidatus Limnocylindrales bacterium]|nr:DUF6114 domain-containing protein [Candidatus Limnocylindrales bacterium]